MKALFYLKSFLHSFFRGKKINGGSFACAGAILAAFVLKFGFSCADAQVAHGDLLHSFPAILIAPNGLTTGTDGNFYGTSQQGGDYGVGMFYRLATNGMLTKLYSFALTNLYGPYGTLAQARDGNFYGIAQYGGAFGYGGVFCLSSNGIYRRLVDFDGTNAALPYAGLVQATDGNLYGTATAGGTNDLDDGGDGVIFRVTTNGSLTTLFSFNITNGYGPSCVLVQAGDGYLYGTTAQGGTNDLENFGDGTIFRISTSGSLTSLFSFNATVSSQPSGLIQGTDGSFYGTTYIGGPFTNSSQQSCGTVFKFSINGGLSTLLNFNQTNGATPLAALIQGADGVLYGTASVGGSDTNSGNVAGFGTVFGITTNGVLKFATSFTGFIGGNPQTGVALGIDGNFYGNTFSGGYRASFQALNETGNGYSKVFRLSTSGMVTIVASFSQMDGSYPLGSLIQASDGNFYGTTYSGGTNGFGTLFRMDTNGVLSNVFIFNATNGADPHGALLQGSDGALYGTTSVGGVYGYGTVFRFTLAGALTTLHNFDGTNGANPMGALIQPGDGNFYGTAAQAGPGGYGTAFRLTAGGAFTNLASFDAYTGAYPGGVVAAPDGNIYGTTYSGGGYGYGAIFQIPTNYHGNWALYFSYRNTNGAYPEGAPLLGRDGNLYIATYAGGLNGCGTVGQLTLTNVFHPIFSFNYTNGSSPLAGLIQGRDGNLYGTTSSGSGGAGSGTVFAMTTGGAVSTLYYFNTVTGGDTPQAGVCQGNDGNLYGTTSSGGLLDGGAVYRVWPLPYITVPPTNQLVPLGSNASFTVAADSILPTGYFWQKNGLKLFNGGAVFGTLTTNLTINAITTNDLANYTVVVTNMFGAITSSVAQLFLSVPPPRIGSITRQPDRNFLISVSATANLTYRIDATTNFQSWIALGNVANPNGVFQYLDTTATNFPLRFYRATWVP